MSYKLLQDWKCNSKNFKGRLILICYRFANLASCNKTSYILLMPYLIFYRIFIEWILGVELPYKTKIGKGLIIYHGQALVINDNSTIGDYCIIRHSTTIGNKLLTNGEYSKSPFIGNNVDIGANVCIIGPIFIGDNVKIGAGSVVVKNIPSNCIVGGNPAKIISYL